MFKRKLVDSKGNPAHKRTCVAPLDAELAQSYLAQPCRDIRELLDQFIPRKPPPLDLTQPVSALYLLDNVKLAACIGPDDLAYVTHCQSKDPLVYVLSNTGVLQRTIRLNREMDRCLMCVSKQGDLFVSDLLVVSIFNARGNYKSLVVTCQMICSMVLNHDSTQLIINDRDGCLRVFDIQKHPTELDWIAGFGSCINQICQLSDGTMACLTRYGLELLSLSGNCIGTRYWPSGRSLYVLDNDQLLVLEDKNGLWRVHRNLQYVYDRQVLPSNAPLYYMNRFRDGRLLFLGYCRTATLNKNY